MYRLCFFGTLATTASLVTQHAGGGGAWCPFPPPPLSPDPYPPPSYLARGTEKARSSRQALKDTHAPHTPSHLHLHMPRACMPTPYSLSHHPCPVPPSHAQALVDSNTRLLQTSGLCHPRRSAVLPPPSWPASVSIRHAHLLLLPLHSPHHPPRSWGVSRGSYGSSPQSRDEEGAAATPGYGEGEVRLNPSSDELDDKVRRKMEVAEDRVVLRGLWARGRVT